MVGRCTARFPPSTHRCKSCFHWTVITIGEPTSEHLVRTLKGKTILNYIVKTKCRFSEVDSLDIVLREVIADLRSQTERLEQLILTDTGQSVNVNFIDTNNLPRTDEITDIIPSCEREIKGDQLPSGLDSSSIVYISLAHNGQGCQNAWWIIVRRTGTVESIDIDS